MEVMGWTGLRPHPTYPDEFTLGFPPGWTHGPNGPEPLDGCTLPPYSTSIADAWEVVEKMNIGFYIHAPLGNGFYPDPANPENNGMWCANFVKPGHSWMAFAATAPEAICLAALASLGQGGKP